MKDLYFLKGWNNYSNRILKPTERDIVDFLNLYPDTTYEMRPSINFNPADGVKTGVTVNWGLSWTPSYLIVVEDDGIISSTWFVMEFERNLVGQYRALLRRDVLNDFKDETLTATSYVEKGTLPPSNPLIFNKENVGLNQIKKSETLLKDTTNSAWVVGYVSKSDLTLDEYGKHTISTNLNPEPSYTEATFPFPELLPTPTELTRDARTGFRDLQFNYKGIYPTKNYVTFVVPERITYDTEEGVTQPLFSGNMVMDVNYDYLEYAACQSWNVLSTTQLIQFNNLAGKTLLADNGKVYKIKVEHKPDIIHERITFNANSSMGLLFESFNKGDATLLNSGTINGFASIRLAQLVYEETTDGQLQVDLNNERIRCTDAPYDIFAIPYNAIPITYWDYDDHDTITADPTSAIAIAQAIQVQLTDSYVYDVQLLPYCPIPGIGTGTGIDLTVLGDASESLTVNPITLNGYWKNVLLWCRNSIGNLTIPYSHPVENLKVDNQTQMTRICSPNYAGIFEMSAAKNYGIDYMDVNFTYKPYNPFIHVAPNFKGLYGASFNDARGLICGGDFSLAKLNDAWANYELQNKNYQTIFDRNIQSMDVMHRYDRIELGIGALTGTAGGVAGGAMAGGLVNGSGGAFIGGVAGGVASAIGGAADFALGEARYKEQRALSIDQFGLQLDNIKALPTTLSKTTALTNNNKIWPFVEEYDCTDEEKEAFRNKLTYDGMTIGIVGKFKDYVAEGTKSYVKGRIIRFPSNFSEDDHLANTIFNEALMGFYTEG